MLASPWTGLHCAVLSTALHRQWVRLVGTEYDVQAWAPPPPQSAGGGGGLLSPRMEGSGGLLPSPFAIWSWVTKALSGVPAWAEPLLRHAKELLPRVSLSLIGQSDEGGWVRVAGLDGETHKEAVMLRLGVVHIYVHEEYGRQPQRRLIFSSDARLSLHVPQPIQQ